MLGYTSMILAAIVFAFAVLVFTLRIFRRRATKQVELAQTDFAIEELHALMRQGKLSREEFERARASVLSRRRPTAAGSNQRARGFEILEPRDQP